MTSQEQLQKQLQEEINSTTYSPRVEAERRQSLYSKNEAEKEALKVARSTGRFGDGTK